MDDIWWCGTCGTLWPYWWRGPHPGPDPWPWLRLVAGFAGGVIAWLLVGQRLGAGGGVVQVSLIGVMGGNFLAAVVNAAAGAIKAPRASGVT